MTGKWILPNAAL